MSLSDAIGIVNLTKRHRGEILTALDAKATFLRPIPLLKKIELVFLKNGSSPQQNLKEDPDAFLAVGVLERLIRKHFLADKEGAEVSEESAG